MRKSCELVPLMDRFGLGLTCSGLGLAYVLALSLALIHYLGPFIIWAGFAFSGEIVNANLLFLPREAIIHP